jgi:hypothetical protein
MPSRADKFPDQPEMLSVEGVDSSTSSRFEPETFRAFGSVPKMLRDDRDPIDFENVDPIAWERSSPVAIGRGLFGAEGRYSVNGLALGVEHWNAIVRSHNAFATSVRGKTIAANRQTNGDRRYEKELHSIEAALASKKGRHDKILRTLRDHKAALDVLLDMQRTPGYHRRQADVDVRLLATTAREQVFTHMLDALGDQYKINPYELAEVEKALDYRLLYGSSRERIQEWGAMLWLGKRYTTSVESLFTLSARKIDRAQVKVNYELEDGDYVSGLRALGGKAVDAVASAESPEL